LNFIIVSLVLDHSTINPVCPLEEHPIENRQEYKLYDPHVRIWKNHKNIKYVANPHFRQHQYHCIPVFNEQEAHLFHHPLIKFIETPIHFHLHWLYGKKIEQFFKRKNLFNKQSVIDNQSKNIFSDHLPNSFWQKREEWIGKVF